MTGDEQLLRLIAVIVGGPILFMIAIFISIMVLNARHRRHGFIGDLDRRYSPVTMSPTHILLHTAASERPATAADVDRWHAERMFFRSPVNLSRDTPGALRHIGYHYYIRRDGTLELGRFEDEVGAHCADGEMNRRAIGICLDGHGDIQVWTGRQRETLLALLRDIYTRHPKIAVGGTSRLLGHREVDGVRKTCPGLLIDMDEVRDWYARQVIASNVRPIDALPLEPMPLV